MKFNTVFLGRENVVVIVVEYDQHINVAFIDKNNQVVDACQC